MGCTYLTTGHLAVSAWWHSREAREGLCIVLAIRQTVLAIETTCRGIVAEVERGEGGKSEFGDREALAIRYRIARSSFAEMQENASA